MIGTKNKRIFTGSGGDVVAYWKERVTDEADLQDVGHRSFSLSYNGYIYQRRAEVLRTFVEESKIDVSRMRILDVGCGSGFYAGIWKAIGARDYMGLDVSEGAIEKLRAEYPGYSFICSDISQDIFMPKLESAFDVVTVLDVMYHITDDISAQAAFRNISRCVKKGGYVILFDQLVEREGGCCLTPHVKLRNRDEYYGMLQKAGLRQTRKARMFVFLVPPVSGWKWLDIFVAAFYKGLGSVTKRWEESGVFIGKRLLALDRYLLSRGLTVPNHEMIICRKWGNQGVGGCETGKSYWGLESENED